MSFTELGNGTVIQPSPTTYTEITLTGNVTLVWPFQYAGMNVVSAMYITVEGVASSGYVITLPNADMVSVGASIVFQNDGGNTFSVVDADGDAVATVPAGSAVFCIVADNTDAGGIWQTNNLGAGSSVAQAAPLAGQGLKAITTTLNVNSPVTEFFVPTTFTAADRCSVYVWSGGSATQTLPAPNAVGIGDGFSLTICNVSAAGILTVSSVEINNAPTFNLYPTQTAVFVSDGISRWYTYGNVPTKTIPPTVNVNSLDVTGESSIELNDAQTASIIQNITGTLLVNCEIIVQNFPTYYFVNNEATGADIVFKDADSVGYTMVTR